MPIKYSSYFPYWLIRFVHDSSINGNKDLDINLLKNRLGFEPLFIYTCLLEDRDNIRKDLKGLSGIYLWYNKINGKIYIGSSVDLYKRIRCYYQPVYLKRPYPIMLAITKYKLNSFILVILEINGRSENDDRNIRLNRETYYLTKYVPEYNILAEGGSSLNYKHSIETRNKIRAKALKRDKSTIVYSKEFIYRQKNNKFGINNPMYGRKWSDEKRLKIAKPVYVYDSIIMDLLFYFPETVLALKKLKMGNSTLKQCLLLNKPFKNKIFSRIPIIKTEDK